MSCFAFGQTYSGYVNIFAKYHWDGGLFKRLGIPAGDSAQFLSGQAHRQGSVYMDTVNTAGSPNGFYIWEDPLGGNSPYWNLQTSQAQICQNRLITEWSVSWQGTSFNFSVHGGLSDGTGSYQIGCNFYTADSATIVLSNADPDDDRIDIVYLDATGVHVREGDLSAPGTAVRPTVNAEEILLTEILVAAGSTSPAITTQVVYDENTESVLTNTGTTTDGANATNVFQGTLSANVTNINHNDNLTFTKVASGTWNVLGVDGLTIAIKLKAAYPADASLAVALQVGGTTVGSEIIVPIVKSNFTTYQQLTIPLSAFGNILNTSITNVRFRYIRQGNNAIYSGFYLDYIYFVDGLATTSTPQTAQFTLNMPGAFLVVPTNTQTSPGVWNVLGAGNSTQYITGAGALATFPDLLTEIGPIDGRAKSADGATIDGDTLFMQHADSTYPGLLSAALFRKINANDSITNIGDGDSLLVVLSDSLMAMKTIKITGGTLDVDDSTITINVSGTSVTQGEGIAITGDSVHLGGTIGAEALMYQNRFINTNRKGLYFTNGDHIPHPGGVVWQHSDTAYSPFQFISKDTLTADGITPTTQAMPVSGLFARRTLFYNSGIRRTQKIYGHYLGMTYDWLDSMRFDTQGGDYNQATIAELRLKPRGTGAQRTGIHGTGTNNLPYYSVSALVGNIILTNSGGLSDGSTSTIHTYGWLNPVKAYLVTGSLDTVERASFFQTGNFLQGKTGKLYGIDFQHNLEGAGGVDSSFGIWDQYGYNHYLRGKAVFGTSVGTAHTWSSADQVKIIGNLATTDSMRLGKASPIGDTTGYDFVLRQRTDGGLFRINASDMAAFFSGGTGGLDDVLAVGQVLTTDRSSDGGAFTWLHTAAPTTSYSLNVYNTAATASGGAFQAFATGTTSEAIFAQSMKFYGVRGKTFHSSATAAGRFEKDNNTPNSVEPVLDLTRIVESATSTAGATGIGGAIDMYLENDNDDEIVKSNRIIWKYTDATNGSEDSEFELWGMVGGVMTLFQTIGAGGVGGGTGSNLSWDGTNHEVDIDGGGTSAVIPLADASTFGLIKPSTGLGVTAGVVTTAERARVNTGGVTTQGGPRVNFIEGSGITVSLANGTGDLDVTIATTGLAPTASPTFTGTVTIPSPFTLGATSVTTTGTQLNYLNAATGTTGTTSTNVVFSTSPTITTPVFSGAISTTDVAQNGTNASGTGYIPYIHQIYVRSDETLTNVNTDQNLFTNSAHDVITVQANTTYKFFMSADKTSGAVSHSVSLGFLPTTATVTNIEYTGFSWITAVGTQTASNTNFKTKATATTAINAAGANATNSWILWGTITIGATGGTITPQIKFSTDPGGTILLKAGSYFSIQAIGNNTFTEQGPIN